MSCGASPIPGSAGVVSWRRVLLRKCATRRRYRAAPALRWPLAHTTPRLASQLRAASRRRFAMVAELLSPLSSWIQLTLHDKADSLEAGAGKQPPLSKPAAMARSCNSCSGLWQTVGQVYAQLLLALAAASSLQQPGPARSAGAHLQWYVLVWCHAGGAAVITCCYVRLVASGAPADKLGSLRRAHRAAGQHAFLRAAAAVLGLAALAEGALEAVVHAGCGGDARFTLAVLRALFTFLQMHFLFIDSQQVVVGGAGALARLGSAHLVAANLAPCMLAALNAAVAAVAAPEPTSQAQGADNEECILNSVWGRLWQDASPFLQPIAVQFSVVAALATYASARPASRRPAGSALDAAAAAPAASAAPTSSSSAPRLPVPLRGGGRWCCCGGGAARGLWAGLPLLCAAGAACALRLQPASAAPASAPPPALLSEGARAAALSGALVATVLAATALRGAPVSRLHRRLSRSAPPSRLTCPTTAFELCWQAVP
ncbi:uncharacterized protein LOC124623087 [Schistocerca americana]|uniref:uncharacterized protein LOC124623087 n=1 Tax=Schistocerca americana TaxID=7009 RepID=UPI001F4F87D2|nr:uncharacterized protein LOC124623087 [Schistocerca americana]